METRDAPKAMLVVICAAALSRPAAIAAQPATRAERLIYHPIASDAQGRIVPWNAAEPGKSYDDILRRIWTFWRTMRTDRNGVRYFMQHQVWKELEDDQRGLGGDQVAMALSSWNLLHGYLGDRAIVDNMVSMADYYLAHSFSKPSGAWPNLPYPYNTDLYSGEYDGDMVAGKGSLQPDKAASFAAELVMLSKITGTARYLEAAVRMADVLAERVRPGDERNSPWPFRVDAATGAVHRSTATAPSRVSITGTTRQPSYTTNFAPALRLFDDLIAMKQGHLTAYRKAHRLLTTWLKRFPIANNRWGPFFEDVPTHDYSDTEINAETLAWYILQRRAEWDPAWQRQVAGILSWVDATFSDTSWARYGVIATREQTDYPVPGNSHTARHASVELAFCQATGECARAPGAVLRLNWATYMVDADGKNYYPTNDIWLTDGYGDYVRHYLRAMAADPDLAPADANHLLSTSSVVQAIDYGSSAITYTKFDRRSVERFKLGAWAPRSVDGGTMRWNSQSKVLEIEADAATVTIRGS